MYIIELFFKLKDDYKNKKGFFAPKNVPVKTEQNETEKCSHIFVPIDSTKEVLACSKCGMMAKRSEIQRDDNGNFFMKGDY